MMYDYTPFEISNQVFHLKKNLSGRRQEWGKFTYYFTTNSITSEVMLRWNFKHELLWLGAIYIKNAEVIPLSNPKVQKGP